MLECISSASLASSWVESIMDKINQQIQNNQTAKLMPSFIGKDIMKLVFQINFPVAIIHEAATNLHEELWSTIPKITKDNLMPKDVATEKDQSQFASVKFSTINMKQHSSMVKKISTTNSRTMKSVTLTQRRSVKETKKSQSPCEMLQIGQNQQEDQVDKMRERTEARLKFDLQYRKLSLFREKSFKDKSKMLQELFGQSPEVGVTHDYEGQQLKSSIIDDKIKHYSMRAEFGTMMKRKKQQMNQPVELSIQINKYQKEKEHPHKLVKAMEMPLFPVEPKDFSHLHQIKNYKLHDYRKHFGRKYSRLDQYSQTLQLSSIKNKEQHKQEIFSERKHLRDSSLLQASRQTVQMKGHMRRLALPRLHGKYKVLDRYDQV